MNKCMRILALLLTVVMMLGLCGSAMAENPGIELEVWVYQWENWQAEWQTEWTEKYNEATEGVTVNLTFVPETAWEQKIKASQAAGIQPDAYTVGVGSKVSAAVATGSLEPLDDYIPAEKFADLMPLYEGVGMVDGKHYAIMYQCEAGNLLFYRKDLFEKAGLDPNAPPATWEELIADAEKLTDGYTYGFQLNTDEVAIAWTSWAWQMNTAGHLAVTDNWDKALVNEQGYKDLGKFFKELHDKELVPAEALCSAPSVSALCEGSVAMLVAGAWNFVTIQNDYPELVSSIGVAKIPTQTGDITRGSSTVGGWCLGLDAKSEHKQEAADYLSWLLLGDPEIMIDYCKRGGFGKSSTRTSVAEAIAQDPELKDNEWLRALNNDVLPYAFLEPAYDWAISAWVSWAINAPIVAGMDIDEAWAKAEEEINKVIEVNGLAGTNPLYKGE